MTPRLPKLCSWLPGNSPPLLLSPLLLLCLSAALPHLPSSSFPLSPPPPILPFFLLLLLFTSRHHPATNTLNQLFVPPACPFQIRLHATIVSCVQDNPYDFTPYIKNLIILKQNNNNEKTERTPCLPRQPLFSTATINSSPPLLLTRPRNALKKPHISLKCLGVLSAFETPPFSL